VPVSALVNFSGQPAKDFVDYAVRHVLLRQGVLGIKVKIMLDSDPTGRAGPKKPLPDSVTILVRIIYRQELLLIRS
jgi:small subunit ribosomal protein S3e